MIDSYFFTTLNKHWESELPFVVYRKPNTNKIVAQLQNSISLEEADYTTPGFVFAPFTLETDPLVWFSKSKGKELSIPFENSVINTNRQSFLKQDFYKNSTIGEEYRRIFNKALEVLKKKGLQKVVLSRMEILEKVNDPLECFQQLCVAYPNTFCYCWYHPNIGMWLGATPETLIKLEQASFKTMALAGTQTDKGQINVVWREKEREEQRYVVDSIVSELEPVINRIVIGDTKTQKAGDLLHLRTDIRGTLRSSKALKSLIEVLHPTPAVCGLPKKKAKEFILKNEGYNRKYYTGYLGTVNLQEKSELFVNLRCMELEKNRAKIYAGGGITALSNLEEEWIETVNKSQIIRQIL